jgi:hypothetical protein
MRDVVTWHGDALQNVRYLCARQQSYRCSAPTSRARVKPAARARWLQHLQLRYVCAYNTYVHRVAARQITLDTVTSTLGSALLGPFSSLPFPTESLSYSPAASMRAAVVHLACWLASFESQEPSRIKRASPSLQTYSIVLVEML